MSEFSARKIHLVIVSVFLVLLVGCTPAHQLAGEQPNSREYQKSPERVFTPGDFKEVTRLPSSDGKIEAVLVTREGLPFGDPDYEGEQLTQTSLYILPAGKKVAKEESFHSNDFRAYLESLKTEAPFIGFGGEPASISWSGPGSLKLECDGVEILMNKSPSQKVHFESDSQTINIEYEVTAR